MRRKLKHLLIIGAGEAGEMVVGEILNHPELGCKIIGLIDDDPKKLGKSIFGVKVLGTKHDISRIVRERAVDEIIIAIPSASGVVIRDFVAHCKKAKVKFKIVPGVYEIIAGKVSINQIREVKPEDLLGRETVEVDLGEISEYVRRKRVLVTGAGGSIGSELSRQLAKFNLEELILLDHNENKLYFIEMELNRSHPFLPIFPLIGDIKDQQRLNHIFSEYRPQIVFHAAAHKHVPLMERNPIEAVKNNIFGTQNMMEAANGFKTERFILISTDKAVNPTSVMGATKRVAEMMMHSYKGSETKFVAVRFGNVLGSDGSVVPLFKKQIAEGGPVTVTHREAQRYFMTIKEAVQLIIQAGAMGEGGEIFFLDMGEPIKIVDLARDLITLSGLEPEVDIKIEYIGLRPGEKLVEEFPSGGKLKRTKHKQIYLVEADRVEVEEFMKEVDALREFVRVSDEEKVIKLLSKIVPTYKI
jgi:FlaA1/EpsC-like NDP-sugar epimerase